MTDESRLRSRALTDAQVEQFIRDGFIRMDRAFPRELAEQGCTIMWRDIPFDAHDPKNGQNRSSGCAVMEGDASTRRRTRVLHAAFDQLGKGCWVPRDGLGSFPVRSPHTERSWRCRLARRSQPGDDCDPNEQHNFSAWRVNVTPFYPDRVDERAVTLG